MCFFFWDPLPESQILTPHLCFWKIFIRCIEQWTKIFFLEKPVDRAGQKPINRPVDRPVNRRRFWNLPVGSGRENPYRFHL